jgi:plastocyanin
MTRSGPSALSRLLLVSAVVLAGACSTLMPEIGALHGSDDAGAKGDAVADAASDRASGLVDAAPTTFTVLVGPGDSHTFSPSSLDIRVGDTVHGVWEASGHTVTSGARGNADGLFCSPNDGTCAGSQTSGRGSTYDHRFTTPGIFPYFCRPHYGSGMSGSVTVQ